ncbi:MAG: protein-methionine-sulfoxide reductase heme-binding subunit MsrQ [Steroidobacteraceae bacterium]
MLRLRKSLLFAACAAPLALLIARAAGVAGPGLGPNPIDALQDGLGQWALRLLLATLCVTPLAVALRKPWLYGLRRMLGLWAFAYAVLHVLNWVVLDHWFDGRAILADVVRRPYVTVGMLAVIALVPLAATSTDAAMRRLGARWHRLHRLVYPAAVLACLHFAWEVKADWREPLLYGVVLAALLGWRIRRRALSARRAAS